MIDPGMSVLGLRSCRQSPDTHNATAATQCFTVILLCLELHEQSIVY